MAICLYRPMNRSYLLCACRQSPAFRTTARLGRKRRAAEPAHEQQQPEEEEEEPAAKKRKTGHHPFQLATEARGQRAREALALALEEERQREDALRQFRARPLPTIAGAPGKAAHVEGRPVTRVQAFPLRTNERGHLKREVLARRLEEEERQERSRREFRARPLPCREPFTAQPATAPLTEPAPFPLRTEDRGAAKVTELRSRLARDEEQDKENRCFRAIPLPCAPPFRPRPTDRPLTERLAFNLSSDARAQHRAAFDEHVRAKEAAEAAARHEAQQQRERQEQKQIRRLRRRLVHKALPIPLSAYRPPAAAATKGTLPPLTDPASPRLHTKHRRSVRPSSAPASRA